jgi:RNA polymerase sigma-70 factor, ECF subfamily
MKPKDATRRFYQHVWPLRATVLRTALFLTRNPAEADDLAQDTLMKAFNAIATFDSATNAKAWLLTILRNTRIDRLRSAARTSGDVSLDQAELDLPGPAPAADSSAAWSDPDAMVEQFSDQRIIDALHQLPEAIRWTLLLVDVEQLDFQFAAQILGVPPGTAKSRAHRGRQMLRELLSATPSASSNAFTPQAGGQS